MFGIKQKSNGNTTVLLAENEAGQILGSAVVTIENNQATLDTIQTNPVARGSGVGIALLQETENLARTQGIYIINGKFTPDSTQPAEVTKKWYQKRGYSVEGGNVSKRLR